MCTNSCDVRSQSHPLSIKVYARIAASSTVIIIGSPTNEAPTATAPPVLVAPCAVPDREAVELPPEDGLPDAVAVGAALGGTEGVTVAAAANSSDDAYVWQLEEAGRVGVYGGTTGWPSGP